MKINFIRIKFKLLQDQVKSNINIFFISEKKTGVTLSFSQFLIEGFSTLYRLDCYSNDGGTLLYPSKLITIEKPKQSFIVEKTCVMINGWQTAHTIILFSKLIDNLLDALSKYSD